VTGRYPAKPDVSPSQLSSSDKSVNGSFSAGYYSLASHQLLVQAALIVHDHTGHVNDADITRLGKLTFEQLVQCSTHHTIVGYCSRVGMSEIGQTSLFTANLVNLLHTYMLKLGDTSFGSIQLLHQGQLEKGYFDIGWYWLDPKRNFSMPFAVIEYTKDQPAKKESQLRGYANLMLQGSKSHSFKTGSRTANQNAWLPIMGIKLSVDCIIYSVIFFAEELDGTKFVELELDSAAFNADGTVHLMQVMYFWHNTLLQFLGSIAVNGSPSDGAAAILAVNNIHTSLTLVPWSNTCTIPRADGDVDVLKVYDYRRSSGTALPVPRADRRSPDGYKYSTLHVQRLCSWTGGVDGSLDILSYSYVKGGHRPEFIGHFISFLEKLRKLHNEEVVHGDIRFGSVVFFVERPDSNSSSGGGCSSDSKRVGARIIDFDLSGTAGKKLYVSGYNTVVSDGERHAGAKAGSPLLTQHDLHSAAWMMKQFKPEDSRLVAAYDTAAALLDQFATTSCLAALRVIGECVEVVGTNLLARNAVVGEATGSLGRR
jgi:hypothetical protein